MQAIVRTGAAWALLGLPLLLHAAPPAAASSALAAPASLAVASTASAVAPSPAAPPPTYGYFARRAFIVLDRHAPPAARQQALAAIDALAQNGNAAAQFLMGSLYMWGPRHPASLTPRDLGRAANYMSNAAVQGNLDAMAAMAEIEIDLHHPQPALVWALTDYYFHRHGPLQRKPHSYLAGLLLRTESAVPKAQHAGLIADANAFIQRYAGSIEHPPETFAHAPPACRLKVDSKPWTVFAGAEGRALGPGVPHAGIVWVLYSVDAHGRPVHEAVINAFPHIGLTQTLHLNMVMVRFNAVPQCPEPRRYDLLPFHFNDRRYSFRN